MPRESGTSSNHLQWFGSFCANVCCELLDRPVEPDDDGPRCLAIKKLAIPTAPLPREGVALADRTGWVRRCQAGRSDIAAVEALPFVGLAAFVSGFDGRRTAMKSRIKADGLVERAARQRPPGSTNQPVSFEVKPGGASLRRAINSLGRAGAAIFGTEENTALAADINCLMGCPSAGSAALLVDAVAGHDERQPNRLVVELRRRAACVGGTDHRGYGHSCASSGDSFRLCRQSFRTPSRSVELAIPALPTHGSESKG